MGPCQARLEYLGDLLQVVVGAFGEASSDLDRLLRGIAESRVLYLSKHEGRPNRTSAGTAPPIFLDALCEMPGGLSGVPDGASGGGRQGGGSQAEGLARRGGEDPEGGRGLPLRLHLGQGEGSDAPRTLERS